MNFIIINKQTARRWMMTPYIFVKVEECDDTDSNKTEVEEIEMVDMEGRAEVNFFQNPNRQLVLSEIHNFPKPSIKISLVVVFFKPLPISYHLPP